MKNSLGLVAAFIVGAFLSSHVEPIDSWISLADKSNILLYGLLFFIGVGIGSDEHFHEIRSQIRGEMFLIPLSVICGTLLGVWIVNPWTPSLKIGDALAIGSGFGYYSLSSVIIAEFKGETLGILALASNIFREIFTILFAPILVKIFGKLSPIASGGATSMDTTLPFIIKSSGKQYAVAAIFNGITLTFIVPFLVSFFIQLSP